MILLQTHSIKPWWLEVAEFGSAAVFALAASILLAIHLHQWYYSKQSGQLCLPTGTNGKPPTAIEQFEKTLLDNIEDLSDDQGCYVQEAQFWKKVSSPPLLYKVQLC